MLPSFIVLQYIISGYIIFFFYAPKSAFLRSYSFICHLSLPFLSSFMSVSPSQPYNFFVFLLSLSRSSLFSSYSVISLHLLFSYFSSHSLAPFCSPITILLLSLCVSLLFSYFRTMLPLFPTYSFFPFSLVTHSLTCSPSFPCTP